MAFRGRGGDRPAALCQVRVGLQREGFVWKGPEAKVCPLSSVSPTQRWTLTPALPRTRPRRTPGDCVGPAGERDWGWRGCGPPCPVEGGSLQRAWPPPLCQADLKNDPCASPGRRRCTFGCSPRPLSGSGIRWKDSRNPRTRLRSCFRLSQ